MPKPTALQLAMATLRDATVAEVKRRDGTLWIDTLIDQPPVTPGRYVLVDVSDMTLTLKRLTTAEDALQLARLALGRRR